MSISTDMAGQHSTPLTPEQYIAERDTREESTTTILNDYIQQLAKRDEIVFCITLEDVQNTAEETIGRQLTGAELYRVRAKLGEFISWNDAIYNCMTALDISEEAGG